MLTALTRKPSEALADCALEFLDRSPIDFTEALCQHQAYESCLRQLGARVVSLPPEPSLPDAVFVEDPCFVVDELAVITRTGAVSRRAESESLARALETLRSLVRIVEPGTLEGGDLLRIGRRIYAGLSKRTNREGISQLHDFLGPFGYTVIPVEVRGSLHLKTACTHLDEETLFANPRWFDESAFSDFRILNTPPDEPWSANTLRIGDTILLPDSFPRAAEELNRDGFKVTTLDISEFQKAEGGLTCLSVLFDA